MSTIVTCSPSSSSPSSSTSRILYQQYFQPYRDFIIALPLLLGYFKSARDLSPEMSSAGSLAGIKFGFDDKVPSGTSGDQDWLEEFGIAVSAEEESVKTESKPVTSSLGSNDGATQCLLEGMVAALELFDIQSHHPFVVPDFTGSKSTKGTTPSPFPAGKQLAGASALTPQTRPSPLLSALHLTPTSSRIPRRSGQSGVDEKGRTDTYLIVFAGKDPHYLGEFPPVQSKTSGPDSARSTRINTLKDPTSDVLTGLPSPSPSPEERHSRSNVKAAAIAPPTSRQTVRENRSRYYDGFGWEQVLEEMSRRDVAFGWVILQPEDAATIADVEDGVLAKLFEALKKRPQGKSQREFLVEGPWWTAKDGEKAMFKGLNAVRMVKPEIETKLAADTEKNANGEFRTLGSFRTDRTTHSRQTTVACVSVSARARYGERGKTIQGRCRCGCRRKSRHSHRITLPVTSDTECARSTRIREREQPHASADGSSTTGSSASAASKTASCPAAQHSSQRKQCSQQYRAEPCPGQRYNGRASAEYQSTEAGHVGNYGARRRCRCSGPPCYPGYIAYASSATRVDSPATSSASGKAAAATQVIASSCERHGRYTKCCVQHCFCKYSCQAGGSTRSASGPADEC